MSQTLDEDAITPVIGAIMILGISVLGITAVMFWGAPALQIMQEQNAQAAMLGEFQEIRQNSLVLTITDSSRLPRLNLEGGDLLVEDATRMAITIVYDVAPGGCTLDVPAWDEATDTVSIALGGSCTEAAKPIKNAGADNCVGGDTCLRFYTVEGRSLVTLDPASGAKLQPGQTKDFPLDGDIDRETVLIRYEAEDQSDLYAETWILHHQALHWEQPGRTEPFLHLEAGAMFSGRAQSVFIEEDPPIAEEAFGTDELALRIPLFEGPLVEKSGAQSVVTFLRLEDNILRVDDSVWSVQYDFEGDYAEAWCTAFFLRDDDLTGSFAYTQPYGDRTCDGSSHPDGRTTIVFDQGGTAFPFAFTHVQISIQI